MDMHSLFSLTEFEIMIEFELMYKSTDINEFELMNQF